MDPHDIDGLLARAARLDSGLNRVIRWPKPWRGSNSRAGPRFLRGVRALGFVVWPGAPHGQTTPGASLDQHVALVVRNWRDREWAVGALFDLAARSARAHLLVDAGALPRRRPGRRALRRAQLAVAHGEAQARRALAHQDFGAADAWLAAALTCAAWRLGRAPRSLETTVLVRLRAQGRVEEAAAVERQGCAVVFESLGWAASGRSPQKPALTKARRPQEEHTMMRTEGVPELLHLVAEAEDDLSALASLARWARHTAGADFVAIVTAPGGGIVASDGPRGEALHDDERRTAAGASAVCQLRGVDGVSVIAPVRYAGVCVGAVVVRGHEGREATIEEAGRTVAAVGGPALRARADHLGLVAAASGRVPEIVGRSPAIEAVRQAIVRAAATPFAVVIEGESGTGKELVARAIHRLSPRRDRRFAAINCAALADELVDAELFGHARGAFTGAAAARAGLFEEASGSTLFLDEVAELSARTQAKLLRTIQEREVRRVGENAARPVDARLIAATNRSLPVMVADGRFRDDLLFRLAVVQLRLPALRDRSEDVSLLAATCWVRIRSETGTRANLAPDAMARLTAHTWPGNVRELQNVMARLSLMAPARGRVTARHVDAALADSVGHHAPRRESLVDARASVERRTVAAALARHGGRRMLAARDLGLSRQGLTKAIRRLSLDAGRDSCVGVA